MIDLKKYANLLPYIIVVFLNAIVDLGDKILLQNTIFKVYEGSTQVVLTAFVNMLIILPGILFFTPSGVVSDRYPKTKVLFESSKVALVLTILTSLSYFFGLFKIALFLTFLLATQSAFFFPAKYALIKELFGKDRLPEGNGIVQATTIIAILLSSLLFSLLFEKAINGTETTPSQILQHIAPITLLLIAVAILQTYMAKKVPIVDKGDESLELDMKKLFSKDHIKQNLSLSFSNMVITESIIGLALFYGVAQVVLAIFGVYLKDVANEHNTVIAQGIMALSGVGIAIGALLTAKFSKNYIETGLIPVGIAGITLSLVGITHSHQTQYLAIWFLLFGLFGGFILVVLNALIQYRAKDDEMGRVMATSNLVQNIFMTLFLLLTIFVALKHIDTVTIFHSLIIITLLSFIYTLITLPQFLLRFLFKIIASSRYKLIIDGVENFPKDGAALLLGNHISWIDWMVLAIASPRRVSFVIERGIYNKWYLKPIFKFFGLIPISTRASKEAFKGIREKLNEGKIVALFPEGAITRNGHLGAFQKGYELAIKDMDIPVIPFCIRGLWGSRFSYANSKHKENTKYRDRVIGVTFGKQQPSHIKTNEIKKEVVKLLNRSWERYTQTLEPLAKEWIKMSKRRGEKFSIADATGTKMGAGKFVAVVKTFANKMAELSKNEQNIAIIMPPSVGGTILNMSVLMLGKTIVNLNYTANHTSLLKAIEKANIKKVYTSKQFITKLKAKGIDLEPIIESIDVIYVEDIKSQIKKSEVLKNWVIFKITPRVILESLWLKKVDKNDTAAILFSSGSEGTPKGIELTHKNFMANIKQFCHVLNFQDSDVMMATLPTFHVFGLTVSTLAPLIEGVPFVCQPDPTDAVGVGKLAAKYKTTLLFGTSTFFRIYTKNRKLLPLMFESVRFVVGGAEKLSNDVRDEFKSKFGLDIYEAYGATETTPGISANIPDKLNTTYWNLQIGQKIGSVGMPFPGTICKIVDPESFEELGGGEDGMIIVSGPQVMKGYLGDTKKTKEVLVELDGKVWYVTGDKGRVDEDGFLTIVDRYSRFAKVAGEMISLGAVEEEIRAIIPNEVDIVAANTPDAKKGERVVLLFSGEIEVDELKELIKNSSLNPLMQPTSYHKVDEMPKLGSGKSDLKLAKKMAMELEGHDS